MAISSQDEFEKKLDHADNKSYPNIPNELKEQIHQMLEKATAQADPETIAIVQDAEKDLFEQIDKTHQTEESYVSNPETWRDVGRNSMARIKRTVDDLGHFVGASAQNAKENINLRKDKIFEKATNVVASLQEMKSNLVMSQEDIEKQNKEKQEKLQEMQEQIFKLRKMLSVSKDPTNQKMLAEAIEHAVQMTKNYAEVYQESRMKKPHLIPSVAHEAVESATDALQKVNKFLRTQVSLAKTAVRTKSESLFSRIAKATRDTMKKAKDYMTSIHQSLQKAVAKGKTTIEDFKHLNIGVGVVTFDDRKDDAITNVYTKMLAEQFVKKQAKDGISFRDTKNAAQEFTKNLSKQIDTVMQKESKRQIT